MPRRCGSRTPAAAPRRIGGSRKATGHGESLLFIGPAGSRAKKFFKRYCLKGVPLRVAEGPKFAPIYKKLNLALRYAATMKPIKEGCILCRIKRNQS